jgi:hypothetical protein
MAFARYQTHARASQGMRKMLQMLKAVDVHQNVKTDVLMPSAQVQICVSVQQDTLRTEQSRQTTFVSDESNGPAPPFRSGSIAKI